MIFATPHRAPLASPCPASTGPNTCSVQANAVRLRGQSLVRWRWQHARPPWTPTRLVPCSGPRLTWCALASCFRLGE